MVDRSIKNPTPLSIVSHDYGLLPVTWLAQDVDQDTVMRLSFARPVTAEDRENILKAINLLRGQPAPDTGQAVAYVSQSVLRDFDPNGTEIRSALLFPKGMLGPVGETPLYTDPAPLDAERMEKLEAALKRIAELKPERDSSSEYNRGWEDGRYQAQSIANAALGKDGGTHG